MRVVVGASILVVVFTLCIGLGLWQLDRADEKRTLFQLFALGETKELLTELELDEGPDGDRYRRVELRGSFSSSQQFLLDAMTHAGRAGYEVLTPFKLADTKGWVIVNRGWVAALADRAGIPDVAVRENPRTIRGRIDSLPRPGLRLAAGTTPALDAWPRVLLFPRMSELEAALKVPLFEYQLLLDPSEPDGFVREWQPRAMPPERHVAYAVQWFALAATVLCIGVILGVRRSKS